MGAGRQVGILTDFTGHDPAYSLCNVVADQLWMFLGAGYQPVLIADIVFEARDEPWTKVEVRKLPGLPRGNRLRKHETWDTDLNTMTGAMREVLAGIDVVLSHDLIYQPAQILHNLAARTIAAERPEVRWLHWIHSATPPAVLSNRQEYVAEARKPFPHSLVVYPNEYSKRRIATNFGYEEDQVVCVHHSTDVCRFLGLQEDTRALVEGTGLLGADAIGCYPVRLDRGKQPEFIVRIFAQLKRLGCEVRLVIVDFHSTGGDKVTYREELKELGQKLGLILDKELIFTSEQRQEWQVGVPRAVVRDLMLLANVFIQPSRSETYSLVAQEAALCGNLLVLNFDFPPMRDIYGEKALYFKFSSGIDAMTGMDGETTTEYQPNANAFCYDIAMRLIYELHHNLVLAQQRRLRKERNPEAVFRNELEPLLYAGEGS